MVQPFKPSGFPQPGPRLPTTNNVARVQPTAGNVLGGTTAGGNILQRLGASFTNAFKR